MAAITVSGKIPTRTADGQVFVQEVTLGAGSISDTIAIKETFGDIKHVTRVWKDVTSVFDQSGNVITVDTAVTAGVYRFEGRP